MLAHWGRKVLAQNSCAKIKAGLIKTWWLTVGWGIVA